MKAEDQSSINMSGKILIGGAGLTEVHLALREHLGERDFALEASAGLRPGRPRAVGRRRIRGCHFWFAKTMEFVGARTVADNDALARSSSRRARSRRWDAAAGGGKDASAATARKPRGLGRARGGLGR